MERLLGMFERNNFIVLSMRFARRSNRRFGTKAFDNRRWCHHATDTRAPKARLHILLEYCIWRCLPVSGSMPGKFVFLSSSLDYAKAFPPWFSSSFFLPQKNRFFLENEMKIPNSCYTWDFFISCVVEIVNFSRGFEVWLGSFRK